MSEAIKNHELAAVDYMSGMKYKDIAAKYGVKLDTVKSWKKRYGWDRKKGAHKNEKGCTQKDSENENVKKPVWDEVSETMENAELSDKQRLFCVLYTQCFNATKAYQKAYGVSYETAAASSYRMLENVGVKNEIQRLKQSRLNREMLSEEDIFQKYIDIAFADIKDYLEWGQEERIVMGTFGPVKIRDEKTGKERLLKETVNVVRFKESADTDGTLISEVKQGRNGTSIKLADRMKALQWLSDHMNLATEKQKAEIAMLKAKAGQGSDEDRARRQQAKDNITSILEQIKEIGETDVSE